MLQPLLAGTPALVRQSAGRRACTSTLRAATTTQCRHASKSKTEHSTAAAAAAASKIESAAEEVTGRTVKVPDFFSSQRSAGAKAIGGSTTASSALPRARKLTATKAKAQASASKALREQLQATKAASQQEKAAAAAAGTSKVPETFASQPPSSMQARPQTSIDTANISVTTPEGTPAPPEEARLIRDVYAWATAESYNFDVLITSQRLPPGWQLIQNNEVIHIPLWPGSIKHSRVTPGIGEAFIFRSGSYVTWGMSLDQSRKFLRSVIRGRPASGPSAEIEGYDCVGDETMEYIIAEEQVTRVVGDVIVIGQQPRNEEELEGNYVDASAVSGEPEEPDWTPLLARLAFSQGLCRSARLSVQEEELSTYLEEVADMPARLEAEGKVPLPRRQVIRKMGTLLKLRQRANLDTENFLDDPEMYWENGELEHHYDSICQALDIETRFRAYNSKLDHGENLLGVLRALLTESSTHRMELIIIYLIAFEVALALISHNYIPSPESVWNAVADFIGGERYAAASPTATFPAATHPSGSHDVAPLPLEGSEAIVRQGPQQSYLHWLRSYIPGLRGNSTSTAAAAASTEHIV